MLVLHKAPGVLVHPQAHRQIDPPERRRVELSFQSLLGMGMLGHHHQPGSPLVQAVDRVKVGLDALIPVIRHQKIPNGI